MATEVAARSGRTPLSTFLYRRPRLRLAGLLAAPLGWLVVIYAFSLVMLLVTAFWTTNTFTSKVEPGFTLDNFVNVATTPAYVSTALRTVLVAVVVTVLCAVFAVPLGVFMAKVASPAWRNFLAMAITLPLWGGYLVKVFAMRLTFGASGPINWLLSPLGLQAPGYGLLPVIVTLSYLWFPYMAVPVYTAMRQIPDNLFDASADLGARPWTTVRTAVLPLVVPAMIAGSVFTFSLSLGDYIAAQFVGGKTQLIGSVIAANINLNPPLAAAFSAVPIVVVLAYLFAVRRTGALERL